MTLTVDDASARPAGRFAYALIAVAVIIIVAAILAITWSRRSATPLDDDVVAIFPFRLEGVDPSTHYLREGMMDLLAAKLSGEPPPRALDPRNLMETLQRVAGADSLQPERHHAIDAARRAGAGTLVLGEVAGNSARLVLNARMIATAGAAVIAYGTAIGPADSLPQLVDLLVAQLLARSAGEGERLATLTSTSLPALRAYLEGQALYRRGQYRSASTGFARALDADSTFALAALRLAAAASWFGNPGMVQRGTATAWRHRHRLGSLDRIMLEAVAGPDYPFSSTYSALLAARQRYADRAPRRPDAWFELGDAWFHFGFAIGFDDAHERAADALDRAIALDSSYLPAIEHRVLVATHAGDEDLVRRLLPRFQRMIVQSENADGISWRVAVAIGDTATARRIVRRGGELNTGSGHTIVQMAQWDGVELDAADSVAVAQAAAADESYRVATAQNLYDLAMNRGQPQRALVVNERYMTGTPVARLAHRERARATLYWQGDSAAGAAAIRNIEPYAYAADFDRIPWPARLGHLADLCVAEQWRMERGDTRTIRRSIEHLRAGARDPAGAAWVRLNEGCAIMLDAMIATRERQDDARVRVAQLDSLLRAGPGTFLQYTGNLVVARLLEEHGDHAAALAAVRRRDFFVGRTTYLSTYLRQEGRLAALLGDRQGAIAAYTHYLALRDNPEPGLRDEVERVRAKLAALQGEVR